MDSIDCTGLPLFGWAGPARHSSRVAVFPAARRLALVRATAQGLAILRGDDAGEFWEQTVRGLTAEWTRWDLGEADQWHQLWDFHQAVQGELRRLRPISQEGVAG